MSTFRVYLRRPTTKPPVWDWSDTVVAKDASTALGISYGKWQQSTKNVPPLSQCGSNVIPVTGALRMVLADAPDAQAQQQFAKAIEDKVAAFLSTQLDGAYHTVSYPAGFNYGITYGPNAYWNAATIQDFDSLLGVGSSGVLELTGQRFSTMYAQILQAVTFSFSQADQKKMNDQDAAASAQIATILTDFANAGGTFSNPLPFGGKLQDVFNQLTKQFGSLSNLPDSLNDLRNAVAAYKGIAGDSYALHNRWYAATARLQAAIANTTTPSAANGGMQTDATSYIVGYTPNKLPSANQLIGGLGTVGNAVSVNVTLSSFSSSSTTLSVSGQAGVEIPIADVIGIKVGGSSSYDMSDFASSSTTVTMALTYTGVTMAAAAPTPLSLDNSTGWFANDILQEIVANSGQDATGFQLQGSEYNVAELFGAGEAFSRLKTFVISQYPTISITFTGAQSSKVTSAFQVNASAEIDLLGLFQLGSASTSYSVSKVDTSSSDGSVTVTFQAPNVSGTLPLQQQIAYVMGGVASYPPSNI